MYGGDDCGVIDSGSGFADGAALQAVSIITILLTKAAIMAYVINAHTSNDRFNSPRTAPFYSLS